MKTIQHFLFVTSKTILFLSIVLMTSCSNDDDTPAPNQGPNLVALPATLTSTFTGSLVYEDQNGTETIVLDSTATISGTSSNYTITFNNDVPSISNVTFNLFNGQYVYIKGGTTDDPDEEIVVRTTPQLAIDVDRSGNSWEFNGF